MPAALDIDWEAIKLACCAGLSYPDAARKFGVKEMTIRKRAERGNWPTPLNLALEVRRQKELECEAAGGKKAIEIVTKTWQEKGEEHRSLVFEQVSKAIKKTALSAPKSWKEYEIADRVARRAAGMKDDAATAVVNFGMQMGGMTAAASFASED